VLVVLVVLVTTAPVAESVKVGVVMLVVVRVRGR
jgi:hypothetical protein